VLEVFWAPSYHHSPTSFPRVFVLGDLIYLEMECSLYP